MIDGLSGVIIWTDNLDRLTLFYTEVVGMTPHSVRKGLVAFKRGDVRFSIGLHSLVHGQSRDPYRVMVNLNTTDIHADYARMRERGVQFICAPEKERWGGWMATFKDPDGNVLQLMQQPE